MNISEFNELKAKYHIPDITLDFFNSSYNSVPSKQLDNCRYLYCTLTEYGSPRSVKSGEIARFRAMKADKTYIYDTCDVLDGKILIHLTEQVLAVEGKLIADVEISSGENVYSTKNFVINIEKRPYNEDGIISSNEYNVLVKMLNEMEEAKEEARQAAIDAYAYLNNTYTKSEIDNKISAIETNIDWKESVATYSDIATTYPSPQDGWTVNVKDTDYTYRYNGSSWVAISANAIPKATNDVDGLMAKGDFKKLSGIATGAEVNQNAFSNVKVGSSILAADSKTDSFALTGSNVTLTPNTSTKELQIGITKNNVINALGYTPSSSESVSTVDSSLSSTSTNPVQNKVIYNKFETICHISYYTATIDSWIALARIPAQWSGRFYLCFGIAEVIIDLSFHIDHRPALSVFVQREFMHTMLLYTRLVKNNDYSASLCIKPTSDFSGGSTCKIHVQSIGRQLTTNGYNFQLYTSETPITFTSSDVINYDSYYNYEYVND